jgi:aminopeptidase
MSFEEKAAKLAVKYAVDVQSGDVVAIRGGEIASSLIRAIFIEVLKAGAHPLTFIRLSGLSELKFKFNVNDEQIEFFDPRMKIIAEKCDKLISVMSETNTRELELADPEKLRKAQSTPEQLEFRKMLNKKEEEGKYVWTVIPYPTNAAAQDAGMGLHSYKEFVESALSLKDDPVKHWKQVEEEQEKIVSYLNKVDQIHVLGEDTDLTLSVKDRKWVNCCGHKNLPDGEVFTGPIEDSINGHIRFTYPGIYMGKEIENIYLEFENGKVIKATATKGQEILDNILQIENADHIGEFAVGTNYNITKFTKSMLFDEKMGGTLHMALGLGFPETGSKNMSAIHWDILKDMKSDDSKIIADGKIIYEAGKWKI